MDERRVNGHGLGPEVEEGEEAAAKDLSNSKVSEAVSAYHLDQVAADGKVALAYQWFQKEVEGLVSHYRSCADS